MKPLEVTVFELTPPWQDVLNYWFEDGLSQEWPQASVTRKWFRASAGDDAEIEHRFGFMWRRRYSRNWWTGSASRRHGWH